MNSRLLCTVRSVQVSQDEDGRVHWTSRAEVDADGSNGQTIDPQRGPLFAYKPDGTGLDLLANAGYPNKSWRNVLVEDPSPNRQGHPLLYNGGYISTTSYQWTDKPKTDPYRYVDACGVPYIVVNPFVRMRAKGIVMGCRARVTWNRNSIACVVADVSGPDDIGELSVRAAEMLGINPSPRHGGVESGVSFEFWPGTPANLNGVQYNLTAA